MSDWGRIAFYYDYEIEDRHGTMTNIKGLITKAYKYPEITGMVLHAYNGVRYFLNHYEKDYNYTLDLSSSILDLTDWGILNTSFDVFFDLEQIHPGYCSIKNLISNEKMISEAKDKGKLGNYLFNCEGTFGWLYVTFTGNPKDGYELKYGYDLHEELLDIRGALGRVLQRYNRTFYGEDTKYCRERMEYFNDHATLFQSLDELYEVEDKGTELITELLAKRAEKQ